MAKRGSMRKNAPTTSRKGNSKLTEDSAEKAEAFTPLEYSRIENERKNTRGWSKALLFKKFESASPGLCAKSTFQKLLSPTLGRRMPAQPHHRTTLAKAFGWTAEQFAGFLKTGTAPTGASESPLKGTGVKKDPKNVIIDSEISDALLKGELPSLLKCVENTEADHFLPDQKIDKHLFGISTILLVKLPDREQPVLLWYPRRSKDGLEELRKGWSILFNASFDFGFAGRLSPADEWVELANENRSWGREKFVRIPGGSLLELIKYKVELPKEVKGTCRPLGVITRNLRATKERRVYTQYVFETEISLPDATTLKELETVAADLVTQRDSPVSPSDEGLEPDFFVSGKLDLPMDYLALRALRGKEKTIPYKDSQFTRDFQIV